MLQASGSTPRSFSVLRSVRITGLRVGIDPLRREQDVGAVAEFLDHAWTVQQADQRLQGLVREARFVWRGPQRFNDEVSV